ncbi:uncharacterized protein BDW47DRAFT_76431 [Aspergillus candidus]|uniref:Uncharacterized protein n=1 Tax=Aspergillus candidus TaxID=41067 RepID=A0A2I2F1L3_ASPCN|nr:hypothetical protein BDW47DRAFT_76431 [Aspergillus candidus]PLB34509.1 hypothetical protein BDW47DRAFT_76431 [Aspergillus candidus]
MSTANTNQHTLILSAQLSRLTFFFCFSLSSPPLPSFTFYLLPSSFLPFPLSLFPLIFPLRFSSFSFIFSSLSLHFFSSFPLLVSSCILLSLLSQVWFCG